jgi:MFS family permease
MGTALSEPALSDDSLAEGPIVSDATIKPLEALYTREFWLVFSAHLCLNAAANVFVLFPLFVVHLGASAQLLGAIVGTGSLAALIARPLFGPMIDRRGRRAVALEFLLLDIAAIALYLPLHSLGWPIFAVRAIHGATEGIARVALFAMVFQILPEGRRGEGMATFSLCGMIPGAIAPLIGEDLIKRLGFKAFFVSAILLCALAAWATFRLPKDRPGSEIIHPQGSTMGSRYFSLLRDPKLMPLWIVTLLFSLGISCRLSFVAPYAYEQGIARVAWYFLIYSGAAVALRAFSGQLMDRVGLERTVLPSLIVLSGGIALLALTGRSGMLEFAALIGGIGHGYLYPALSALVIGRTPPNTMGGSSTIYTSLYDVGAMVGPSVLGTVASFVGYPLMFLMAGAFLLVAAIYFALVDPHLLPHRL